LLKIISNGLLETKENVNVQNAWINLAKVVIQARFDRPMPWNDDAFVEQLFSCSLRESEESMDASKTLIGLNWYLTGGVSTELEICASVLPSIDVTELVGCERYGGLGSVAGTSGTNGQSILNPSNSIVRIAHANPAFAAKLTHAVLFFLNSLGGNAANSNNSNNSSRPGLKSGRPSMRRQVSVRRNSVFEYMAKDGVFALVFMAHI